MLQLNVSTFPQGSDSLIGMVNVVNIATAQGLRHSETNRQTPFTAYKERRQGVRGMSGKKPISLL